MGFVFVSLKRDLTGDVSVWTNDIYSNRLAAFDDSNGECYKIPSVVVNVLCMCVSVYLCVF